MMSITIRQPDDMHTHFRNGELLKRVIPFSRIFKRCLAMGNLPKPVATAEDVERYRHEINDAAPDIEPVMTIMLIRETSPSTIRKAYQSGAQVLKLIPGLTSTNSEQGIGLPELKEYYPVLESASALGMIFSVHFELNIDPLSGKEIPETDREKRAIPFLFDLIDNFPDLKIVVEHATTREMITAVKTAPENVAATLTAHHALLTTDDVLGRWGKISDPLNYCKPVAKKQADREKIIKAMISGNPKFFFGSDSAPHPLDKKMKNTAGLFTAPVALPLLAEIFDKHEALDNLEDFTSTFGANFYGRKLNMGKIKLMKSDWQPPESINNIPLFYGGKTLHWEVSW
jgi:dihydroorotase